MQRFKKNKVNLLLSALDYKSSVPDSFRFASLDFMELFFAVEVDLNLVQDKGCN